MGAVAVAVARQPRDAGPSQAALGAPPRRAGGQFWRRFSRNWAAVLGLVLLTIVVVAVLFGPLLFTTNPLQPDLQQSLAAPSPAHPLGTDDLGRDILARLLVGGRFSLALGFGAVLFALAIGVPVGAVSGYYGGWVDLVIQRVVDVLLSFPGFLLALSLVALLGVGFQDVIISAGLSAVPAVARLVRALALLTRRSGYVEAARGFGERDIWIIWRHVLPTAAPLLLIQGSLALGSTLLTAAGLGFLGLGVQQPTPEWGSMLGEGRHFIFGSPNLATFPGLAIFLAVLSFNLVGDGLREALDPVLQTPA